MEWTLCSDRMPADGEYVIVATDDTTWVETHFVEYDHASDEVKWFSANAEAEPRPLGYFSHWQHLPDPPFK